MSEITLKTPGVESAVAFPGLSINGFTNSSNSGIVFATLKPFAERQDPLTSVAPRSPGKLNQEYAVIKDAFIAMFPPPPVQGLGTIGGFKLQIEDRAGSVMTRSTRRSRPSSARSSKAPELAGAVLVPSGQRAAALCRHRPHQGTSARRRRSGRVRHDADLSRLALRQRLQQVRPHLFRARAGGCEVSRPSPTISAS